MSERQLFVLGEKIAEADFPYLIKLNREESKLEIFRRCGNEKLYYDLSIRKSFNSDSYIIFEKELSLPCIFGGETTPTPMGLFHIEAKSTEEYISSYYPNHDRVKFFGYLVVFEDYFIHSDLYAVDESGTDASKALSRKDKTTSGCIRVSQKALTWLFENIKIGTFVLL